MSAIFGAPQERHENRFYAERGNKGIASYDRLNLEVEKTALPPDSRLVSFRSPCHIDGRFSRVLAWVRSLSMSRARTVYPILLRTA